MLLWWNYYKYLDRNFLIKGGGFWKGNFNIMVVWKRRLKDNVLIESKEYFCMV